MKKFFSVGLIFSLAAVAFGKVSEVSIDPADLDWIKYGFCMISFIGGLMVVLIYGQRGSM